MHTSIDIADHFCML